jgi:mannose-6-phosphate isomerase
MPSELEHLYPYLFTPVYKDYLWGGNKIKTTFQRENTPTPCAESWEVADRPEGMSIVANGPLKGKSLHDLVQELQGDLLGPQHAHLDTFPLLIKIIDARKDLSVQVHPHDDNAHLTDGEPKTEMWYLLEATSDARIYAGMKPNTTPDKFRDALESGTVETYLASIPARAGRAIFVPGGKVHAIGAGCLLLEVQQNSNTTYRVYDWDRVDADGKRRELHIEDALKVINWDNLAPQVSSPRPLPAEGNNHPFDIITSPYFATKGWNLQEPRTFTLAPPGFRIIFVSKGRALIGANGVVAAAQAGTSCLIPAAVDTFTITPLGNQVSVIEIQAP